MLFSLECEELGAPACAVGRVLRDARHLPGDPSEDREHRHVARFSAPFLGLDHHIPALRLLLDARHATKYDVNVSILRFA